MSIQGRNAKAPDRKRPAVDETTAEHAATARRFNHFYARRMPGLCRVMRGSRFSPAEARVLYEIAEAGETGASSLATVLEIDSGYLSRILGRFEASGLVRRRRSESDARRWSVQITERGSARSAELEMVAEPEIADLIAPLPEDQQRRLIGAMRAIEELLDPAGPDHDVFVLRPHRLGDIGHIASRHGILYAREYGWDESFEALAAEHLARFLQDFDPDRERSWIAEWGDEIVGSVFIGNAGGNVAQLRFLLVEPAARGRGLAGKLVDECVRFSRLKGYDKISLWTTNVLVAARRLYARKGFALVDEEPRTAMFGRQLVGETWELPLDEG